MLSEFILSLSSTRSLTCPVNFLILFSHKNKFYLNKVSLQYNKQKFIVTQVKSLSSFLAKTRTPIAEEGSQTDFLSACFIFLPSFLVLLAVPYLIASVSEPRGRNYWGKSPIVRGCFFGGCTVADCFSYECTFCVF